jgi:hypothetical protein
MRVRAWERTPHMCDEILEIDNIHKWDRERGKERERRTNTLCGQVVDEIFEIDNIVKREKELRHLSRCRVTVERERERERGE